jgi:hypothetical protein
LLGHSDPKVTLAIYTQVFDGEIDEAGDILNFMVNRAHSSEMSDSKKTEFQRV